uniref:Uncharacterized protein n=1 Tax=Arundo donax TaxID=35708 RepID=A0A0A9F1T6_ARUDO
MLFDFLNASASPLSFIAEPKDCEDLNWLPYCSILSRKSEFTSPLESSLRVVFIMSFCNSGS